jgi:hypothetical protein
LNFGALKFPSAFLVSVGQTVTVVELGQAGAEELNSSVIERVPPSTLPGSGYLVA